MPYIFQWPFHDHNSLSFRCASKFTVAAVSLFGKLVTEIFNTTHVHNKQQLLDAIEHRESGRPLITVINHTSVLDDPGLHGVLPTRILVRNNHLMRWSVAAQDVCYKRSIFTWFFSRGRCVPVIRGVGVYQRGIDFCIEKLNQGEWVHIFPEGYVNPDNTYRRLKWGVGRLVAECERSPLIVPMWHVGMDVVRPNKRPYYYFKAGKHVTLSIGDPIDLSSEVERLRSSNSSPMEARKTLTDIIEQRLLALKPEAEKLHQETLVRLNVKS
ncbi:hypothetical protein CAPTEDRAFT_20462 [Capitella teleta]|uniref:Tafazzin family protein n=1 Tax=Capitella teleta TaxID=283909 RepID=R7TQX8_CAPTE|nr:hypothetical protein CAPTEDRAFT_20462 [Capitella teleta]|eukprot:ELT96069.1 hypothetical protein CAPTEDRAFT_20462 [Capitella teleta]